ncbi:MAG: 1-deoxy-D-xylulose-5-phosphate reductoisomerase [Gemmatimonadetes bacterium]|nr:1-deoxy-D-xylulose-5-phosphate reductoisomerase [Gemmatimonadota bacterium]MDA1104051.1 1-deoxy-D-xylulose-5-phosphate reductoisomerase [Gemmatimonadota bacterium]
MIRVAILGSTGSIGRSALQVISRHPDRFEVVGLAANQNVDVLAAQAATFGPESAVLCDATLDLPNGVGRTSWASGRDAMLALAARPDIDVVLNALVGAAGLEPTLIALKAGHRLALANKESLVAGGALVLDAARAGGGEIIPIDSEHSAILQCLEGHAIESVQRVVLTASGGPFRGRNSQELSNVGAAEALQHPTWDMGAKISIDSATLANKALEVIEAHFLYGLDYDAIDAVVHPQSVIHSFVEFIDGSVLAQLGFPTMELPILYALEYPNRVDDPTLRRYDPVRSSPLTFEEIDDEAFPMFSLGAEAGRRSGCTPAVYNAANEIAVQWFLEDSIRFGDIAEVVRLTMDSVGTHAVHDIDDVIAADAAARVEAAQAAARLGKQG